MLKDCYAMKDVGTVVVSNNGKDTKIKTINSVDILKIKKHNVLILKASIVSDEIDNELIEVKNSNFKIELGCKYYETGERGFINKNFSEMSFVKSSSSHSFDTVTDFVYIFADCPYWKIKKELNTYLGKISAFEIVEDLNKNINVTVDIDRACRDIELKTIQEISRRLRSIYEKEGNTHTLNDFDDCGREIN